MAYDRSAIERLPEYQRRRIEQSSLDELSKRHGLLTSIIGTDEELLVEDEWNAIGAEIMVRTADCGSV